MSENLFAEKASPKTLRIGVIQVDGKMPNVALMKLSAWHKKRGDQVTLIDMSHLAFDRVYASKVFVGGSGISLHCDLPNEIEAEMPDYELFKMTKGERIGYTSRGCLKERGCGFCIVKPKEGLIRDVGFDWVNGADRVILLDNNFLASPLWKEKLEYFIRHKTKVCFTQGLDIRLINEENAKLLAQVKYYDADFRKRRIYFAFDDPQLEPIIREKVALLNQLGIPSKCMMFYVIAEFDKKTDFASTYHRFKILDSLGCLPFIKPYNNIATPQLRAFTRWVNGRFYKVCSWEQYNQKKVKP